MSNCPACAAALNMQNAGVYHFSCFECCMRGYARSGLAFDAVKTRSAAGLRAAIEKSHPTVKVEDALALVWKWWRIDHPNSDPKAA